MERRMFGHWAAAAATIAAVVLAVAPAAGAYTVAPGWVASDYATGFPAPKVSDGAGPVGVVFDSNANLLVTDPFAGAFYRVPPGGGTAAASQVADGLGQVTGLAFGFDGKLYAARQVAGEIDEIDPATAATVRTLVGGLACPIGLAVDPLSHDMFVSNSCGGPIQRIVTAADGSTTATWFAQLNADGLVFGPDGTLYAAHDDQGTASVDQLAGTNTASPGAVTPIAAVPTADGIVYSPATSQSGPFLIVNRNDGEIDRVDLNGAVAPIVTGASRGDFMTVGPDHCIYATLQDRVIKLGPATGTCNFVPAPGAPAGSSSGGGSGGGPGGGGAAAARLADLSLAAKARRRVRLGHQLVYTFRVANHGPADAAAVVLTDKLPRGVELLYAHAAGVARAHKPPPCAAKRGVLTCALGQLAKSQTRVVRIGVVAKKRHAYTNRASVKSRDLDPQPGNNAVHITTRVQR
jgi:uncharacterized repeat protein (TIGR01451 family)